MRSFKIIHPKGLAMGSVFLLALGTMSCSGNGQHISAQYPPDNSGKNLRDTTQGPVTPENQKENEADLSMTQKIRQAVVADDSLSANAKNVKIITANGTVTLRGPVNSIQEKDSIASKAKQVAGLMKIDDQIEVKN